MEKKPVSLTLLPQNQHHQLMMTKLDIPHFHDSLILRERVMGVFDRGIKPGCTMITAPPGSGKTLAVAGWLHNRQLPAAWLTLDKYDNEPHRFWTYLLASLDRLVPGIEKKMSMKLHSSNFQEPGVFAMSLINELVKHHYPVTVVLDDIHLLKQEKVIEGLTRTIHHVKDPIRLILIGRGELNQGRDPLNALPQLYRVGMETLAFDRQETEQLLESNGVQLSADQIKSIEAQTEGWAMGLTLMLRALQQKNSDNDFFKGSWGNNQQLYYFLAQEVYSKWPSDFQNFLLKTSVLNRMTPALCNAVTGRTDSRKILKKLSKDQTFVICLNPRKGWYRYHKMLVSFLRLRLYEEQRGIVHQLYQRAGNFFETHGIVHEAVECYLKGRHYAKAAMLIDEAAPDMLKGGRHSHTLSRWLRALPDPIVRGHIRLLLANGWAELLEGRYRNTEHAIKVAEETCLHKDPVMNNSIWPEFALIETQLLKANLAKMEKRYEEAAILMADIMKTEGFQTTFPDVSKALFVGSPETSLLTSIHGFQGRMSLLHQNGEWLPMAMNRFFGDPGGGLKILMAEIHYERNEMDPAVKLLMEGLNEAEANEIWGIYIPAVFLLTKVMVAQGDHTGALQTACEAEEKVLKAQQSQCLLQALQTRLNLLAGKREMVSEWKEQCQLSVCSSPDECHLYEQMTRLRILISQKKYAEASLELSRLLDFTGKHQCLMNQVEIKTLHAICQYHHGKQHEAIDSIEEALIIGQKEGYRRIFMDEGAQLLSLLKAYRSNCKREEPLSPIKLDYLEEIIQGTRQFIKNLSQNNIASTKKQMILEKIEPLTPKETLVLQCLSQRMTNQEIASQLGISVSTVKVHTRNIYSKLFVTNRTQAVESAQEMDLI